MDVYFEGRKIERTESCPSSVMDDDRIRRSGVYADEVLSSIRFEGRPPNLSGSMRRTRVNRIIWRLAPIIGQ